MPTRTPDPFVDLRGGNTRPSDDRGKWVYWGGSFKEALAESRRSDVSNPPFKSVKGPRGLYNWLSSGDGTDDNKLELENDDIWGGDPSGSVSFTVNDGWQVFLYMRSENNDYFEDTAKNDWIKSNFDDWSDDYGGIVDDLADHGWPVVWVQDNAEFSDSRTFFVLNGDDDDYVSVDIDSMESDIGQMKVRLNGEQYFTNTEHDNEVYMVPMWIRRWDPEFIWDSDTPPTPSRDCQMGWTWNEAEGECQRDDIDPDPTPEDICNAKTGYSWNATTKTCDPDSTNGDDFPEVNLLVIGLAITVVLWLSFRVARREA